MLVVHTVSADRPLVRITWALHWAPANELGLPWSALSFPQANSDLYSSSSFRLTHSRPGTVSLSLSENDEEPSVRERPGYHPLEFLVTTGPGPVPRLDGQNVVFGRVLDGINTVIDVTAVPTFRPDARSRQLNQFAQVHTVGAWAMRRQQSCHRAGLQTVQGRELLCD